MLFTNIFPYLNYFNLYETNVTQSNTSGPINSVYHSRLITPVYTTPPKIENVFRLRCPGEILKKQQQAVSLEFCLRKTRAASSKMAVITS